METHGWRRKLVSMEAQDHCAWLLFLKRSGLRTFFLFLFSCMLFGFDVSDRHSWRRGGGIGCMGAV